MTITERKSMFEYYVKKYNEVDERDWIRVSGTNREVKYKRWCWNNLMGFRESRMYYIYDEIHNIL